MSKRAKRIEGLTERDSATLRRVIAYSHSGMAKVIARAELAKREREDNGY